MQIFLFLLLLIPTFVQAESIWSARYLGEYIEHYATDDLQLTAEQIIGQRDELFEKGDAPVFNFGFTTKQHWLLIPEEVIDVAAGREELLLQIGFPLINTVDLYYLKQGEVIGHTVTGTDYPYHQRPIDNKNFTFRLKTDSGQSPDQLLFRLSATNALIVPIEMISPTMYTEGSLTNGYWWGAYFGVMIIIAIYNLVIYFSIREKSFLYYVSYILCTLLGIVSLNGHGFAYLWPSFPSVNSVSITISTSLMIYFAICFTRSYISVGALSNRLDRLLKNFSTMALSLVFFSLVIPYDCSIAAAVLASIFGPLIIYTAVLANIKRVSAAKYLLGAWLIYLTGVTAYALMVLKILPANAFTIHLKEVGSLLDVILLSFGLAAKIKHAQKVANDSLKTTVQALSDANRLKSEFLMIMSHELRTPINGMLGSFEILDQDPDVTRQQKEQIEIGRSSANKMLFLVDELLQLSEIRAGKLIALKEPLDMHKLIEDFCEHGEKTCLEKGLSFKAMIGHNIPQWVEADEHKVRTIVNHLIDNAVKFTSEGEVSISIDVETVEGGSAALTIVVTDSGIGIPEDQMDEIFKPFFQIESNLRRNYQGCGVGLAISSAFAATINGEIIVESVEGEGSEFKFKFVADITSPSNAVGDKQIGFRPLGLNGKTHLVGKQQVGEEKRERDLEREDHSPKEITSDEITLEEKERAGEEGAVSYTVLIVEDEMTNQMIMKSFVKKMGYDSIIADNGAKAVEIVRHSKVDIILMDCQMPVMDGLEATKKIRELEQQGEVPRIPIIAVSANCVSTNIQEAEKAGMDEFMAKPVKLSGLQRVVERHLAENSSVPQSNVVSISRLSD